jgi:hypothetical protein
MAGTKYHGQDRRSFRDLNFKEQAQSINGELNALERMIEVNVERAVEIGKDASAVRESRFQQMMRMAARIRGRVEPED